MTDNTLPFRFRWVSASPDPHKTPMRNNLEPMEIFVEIDIPVKHEYIRNTEPILKEQLGVDEVPESTEPILTPEGMRYALEQLSLQTVVEPVSDDEWEDAETKESADKDKDWDDDNSDDEDEEDIDWDEE